MTLSVVQCENVICRHLKRHQSLILIYDHFNVCTYYILQVKLIDNATRAPLATWSYNQSLNEDTWLPGCLGLPSNRTLRILFTSVHTEESVFGVDVAVDDVSLSNQTCSGRTIINITRSCHNGPTLNSTYSTPVFFLWTSFSILYCHF